PRLLTLACLCHTVVVDRCVSCPYCCSPLLLTATSTSERSTLSLHDALPIFPGQRAGAPGHALGVPLSRHPRRAGHGHRQRRATRSEEHTSELQSRENLVCRLLLEKKKANR